MVLCKTLNAWMAGKETVASTKPSPQIDEMPPWSRIKHQASRPRLMEHGIDRQVFPQTANASGGDGCPDSEDACASERDACADAHAAPRRST